MNTRQLVSSGLASALALGLVSQAGAQDMKNDNAGKKKCFGIAKADVDRMGQRRACAGRAAG